MIRKKTLHSGKGYKVVEINGQTTVIKSKVNRQQEEIHVQKPIVNLLRQVEQFTKQLIFFHVPNQMMRTKALRLIFWALGVRSGVTDLVVPIGGGKTLWIECKYDGGPLRDEQREFIKALEALGHLVYIIDASDAHDAQKQMTEILAMHNITDFRLKR